MCVCDYGCGNEAQFILRNGKHCCSDHCNKCPEVRRKVSLSLSKAHTEGRLSSAPLTKYNAALRGSKLYTDDQFDSYFCVGSPYRTSIVKAILLYKGYIEYKCAICGNDGVWNGKELTLQLDHINGINTDQRLENLRFLCPNCHAQTETFAGKNKKLADSPTKSIDADKLLECLKNSPSVGLALENYNLLYGKDLRTYGYVYTYIKRLLLRSKCFIGQNLFD